MSRDLLSLVNNRRADVESGRGQCARQKRSLGKKCGRGRQTNEKKKKDEKNTHTSQLSSMTRADDSGADLNPRCERTTWFANAGHESERIFREHGHVSEGGC